MMTRIDPNNTQAIFIGASEFDFENKNFQKSQLIVVANLNEGVNVKPFGNG